MPDWLTVTGSGSPVLLAHGWTAFRSVWGDLPDRLAASGYRVISPDLPGWGDRPEAPGQRRDAHGYANALMPLVVEHGPISVIGHSMGGQIALILAARRPDLVRRVVLIGTWIVPADRPLWPPRTLVHVVGWPVVGLPLATAAVWVMARRPKLIASAYRRSVADPDRLASDPRWVALIGAIAARLRGTPPRRVSETLWNLARSDLRDMLHLVRAPTLVIVGERDWSVHPANSSTLAAAIQDATLLRIPGVAHIPYVEAPDVTVRAIAEFLRD